MALSDQEKRFITTARRLEEALAIHGKTEGAHTEIRSEEMMRIAIRYKVYPKEAKWGFKQANWDNGAPIRKLVYELNEKGLLKQVFPSCRFQKSFSRYEDNAYFFMPKAAYKRVQEKLQTSWCTESTQRKVRASLSPTATECRDKHRSSGPLSTHPCRSRNTCIVQ